jgi:signal transduction histidine kinase/ligand-binding sensor domain-containing protein
MALDRVLTDLQPIGNQLIGVPPGNQLEHLNFPLRQRVVGDVQSQFVRHFGLNQTLPRMHGTNGIDQIAAKGSFQQKAGCAGLHRAPGLHIAKVSRQHNESRMRVPRPHGLHDFDAGDIRQLEVDECDVGQVRLEERDCLASRSSLRHQFHIALGFDHRCQSLSQHGMVIDGENSDSGSRNRRHSIHQSPGGNLDSRSGKSVTYSTMRPANTRMASLRFKPVVVTGTMSRSDSPRPPRHDCNFANGRLLAGVVFLILDLLSFAPLAAAASEPPGLTQLDHKVWTTRDGAPARIWDMALDHDGTLWLAGETGLYRFDGLRFREFHAPPGDSDLPAGGYNSVAVARNGDVWVGSMASGIARIRQGRVRFFGERDGFPVLTVMQICEGPDGSIWAIVHGRLMVFDGNHWSDAGDPGDSSNEKVRAVFFDRQGTQWVSTTRSIYYRSRGQEQFLRTGVDFGRGIDTSNFAESRNGELWIAILSTNPVPSSDLRQIDVPGHRVADPAVIHLPFFVEQLTFASDGSLWITGSELNRFEEAITKGKREIKRETFGTAEGLTSPKTLAIFQDQNGDMWLSTTNGIERFQEPVLIKYVDRPLNPFGLGLARDAQGTIWIGSVRAPLFSVRNGQTQEHGPALSSAGILFPDSHGTIWFKTEDGIAEETKDRLTRVVLPKGVQVWAPRQFFELKPGEMDVSFIGYGVFRFVDGNWFKWDLPGQPREPPESLFVDGQGRIWIGYVSGKVGMVDKTSGYLFAVGKAADLGSVQTFLESSEGLICGGVSGIAVFRASRFEVLATAVPAALTGISGMVQAKNGDLWLNGLHGVSRIARTDLHAAVSHGVPLPTQLYTQTDITGPAQGLGFPTAVADATGRIWFNTSGLIAYVDPEHVPHNPLPPNLIISGVEEDGRPVGQGNQVKAGTATIRIPYFGANLFAPEKVKYMYWLHGVDKTWQGVGSRTEAVYTHLGPGKYLFEVKATNGEGVWSASVSTFFTVLPLFYQTWWFETLCVALTVALLWIGLTMRVRYVAARIRLRAEERADERIRIARELHDTLLQGIQGLLLSFHAAAAKVPAESDSKKALEKALATADCMILEGRDRIHRLRTQNLSGTELESAIEGAASELGSLAKIPFSLRRTGTLQPFRPGVADEMRYIVREALTNAFRHSGASQISVTLDYGKRRFTLICCDNGHGFRSADLQQSEEQGHFGLRGMAERADRIGAAFDYQSARGEGTRIRVVLPANRAYSHLRRFRFLFRPPDAG